VHRSLRAEHCDGKIAAVPLTKQVVGGLIAVCLYGGRGSASTSPVAVAEDAFAASKLLHASLGINGGVMREAPAALISVAATSLLAWFIGTRVSYGWGEIQGTARSAEGGLQRLLDYRKYHAFKALCEYVAINAQCAPMKGEGPNSAADQVSLRRGRRSFPVLHCLPGRQERLIRTEL